MTRIVFCFMLCCILQCLPTFTFAQKANKRQAEKLVEHEKYQEALDILVDIESLKDDKYLYYRGLSAYHTRNLNTAIQDLSIVCKKQNVYDEKGLYYLAKAYQSSGEYNLAAEWFKAYLGKLPKDDKDARQLIIYEIKICKTGLRAKYQENKAFVENMGAIVNSPNDESYPVQSPNFANKYYFSSNRPGSAGGLRNAERLKDDAYGKYYADMYSIALDKGNWSTINAVDPLLNSSSSEYLFDFSLDGSILYFMKSGNGKSGEMLTDTFSVDRDPSKYPGLFKSPLSGEIGDRYMRFIDDNTIIFSSNRTGGFGGYDLYYAVFGEAGWSSPVNLGAHVNSSFDEISPYIVRSGKQLFYSSNRPESMGGYDIFSQRLSLETNEWQPAENMNIPINSADDDLFFSVSIDGSTGIFTSNRPGGQGGQDMYLAYLKTPIENTFSNMNFASLMQMVESMNSTHQVASNNKDSIQVVKDPVPLREKKEIVLSPLYFDQDEIILKEENIKTLSILVDAMKVFPETKLILTGSGESNNNDAFDLFFSIKRTEKVYNYLIDQGISATRISLKGLGNKYPIGKAMVNGFPSEVSTQANNRIDLDVVYDADLPLVVNYADPIVAAHLNTGIYTKYKEKKEKPYFKILLTETVQMFKDPVLSDYKDVSIEKNPENGKYQYYIGLTNAYTEIRSLKLDMLRLNFLSAKILPFHNGQHIGKSKMDKLMTIYPELAAYRTENP